MFIACSGCIMNITTKIYDISDLLLYKHPVSALFWPPESGLKKGEKWEKLSNFPAIKFLLIKISTIYHWSENIFFFLVGDIS